MPATYDEERPRPVDSRDVAADVGVSQATVSRALRDDPNVADKTKERVREAADRLGYVPNELGRHLKNRTTRRIAFVADLDNPLWPMLVTQAHDELAARGYTMTLLAERGDPVEVATHLAGGWADGVIITSARLHARLPDDLTRRGIPFVLVNRVIEGVEADATLADNHAGGRAAAEVLVAAGHTRIGALFGPSETSTGRDRESGFRAAIAAAGLKLPKTLVRYGAFDYSFGEQALPLLMDRPRPPTAIFCANDIIAIGATNTAWDRGMRVPGDLALVGFDDLVQASWPVFGLTTIKVPFEGMLHDGIEMLLDRLAGDRSPARTLVHPVLPVLRRTHLADGAAAIEG